MKKKLEYNSYLIEIFWPFYVVYPFGLKVHFVEIQI
jgi:hypothetical protein